MPTPSQKPSLKQIIFQVALLLITSGVAYIIVVYSTAVAVSATDLQTGEVASQDILAPFAISYTSGVLTEQRRESAVQAVAPQYTSADTGVARQQLEHLRAALAYVTSVRADTYALDEQKLADLAALADIQLGQEIAAGILELNDPRWQAVQQEAIAVLEQVMRNTIREGQVEFYRRSVPNLVSLALPEDQTAIVAELVAAFIAPNSFYSEILTEAARQQAADAVESVIITYAAGETVVQRGEVVSAVDIEAMQQLGLAQPEVRWQDRAGAAILVILSTGLIVTYLRRKPRLTHNPRNLLFAAFIFLVFLSTARLAIPTHAMMPYIYPLAAYALTVAALFGAEVALITVVPLIVLTTYGHADAFELTLYYGLGSILGVIIPRREQRITSYLWVGITVASSGAAIITAYRLPQSETDWTILATLASIALLNGIITAGLAVLLHYLMAPMLGQTTPLQLLELSRPDHPLLEYLLRNAPGTYQHSLQVANLAEQAAERINVNSLLTRVGALYHDVGKTRNPQFFIENQIPGQLDTHDDLDPAESAAIIIAHVTDGMELAREHRLPRRIWDFIAEHHGDQKTRYQWIQAVKAVDGDTSQLAPAIFHYPGPRPQSRETALVMLADGCEACVRAKRPANEDDLGAMIKKIVDTRLSDGQLDDTILTLQDLKTIVDSFTATLRGIYHPRVEYPTLDAPTQPIREELVEKDAIS